MLLIFTFPQKKGEAMAVFFFQKILTTRLLSKKCLGHSTYVKKSVQLTGISCFRFFCKCKILHCFWFLLRTGRNAAEFFFSIFPSKTGRSDGHLFQRKMFDNSTSDKKFGPFNLRKKNQFNLQGSLASDFSTSAKYCIFLFLLRTGRNAANFFGLLFPFKTGRNPARFLRKIDHSTFRFFYKCDMLHFAGFMLRTGRNAADFFLSFSL